MHLVFISSLLTLSHSGLYPSSPAPWPSATNYILKSNVTYDPIECSRAEVLWRIHGVLSEFRRGIIGSIARKEPKNFVISPLAASLALSLLTSAPVRSDRETNASRSKAQQVAECIREMGMQVLIDYLADYKKSGLSLASSVFVSPKVELRPRFIETVTKTFRTPLRRVDFEEPIERNNFIRKWAGNQSMNLVNAETSLAVVYVIHFKGEWLQTFNVGDTVVYSSRDSLGREIKVSIMRATGYFLNGYHPKANATFFELPFKSQYADQNMSMFVISPDWLLDDVSTFDFWDNLEEITIEDLMSYGKRSIFDVRLPKLTIHSKIDFKPTIESTMTKDRFFDPGTTKLRGIASSPNLFGHNFVLKTYIEINEEGSEVVTMDTLPDPVASVAKTPIWNPVPFYVLIATTDATPQIIFSGRYYS